MILMPALMLRAATNVHHHDAADVLPSCRAADMPYAMSIFQRAAAAIIYAICDDARQKRAAAGSAAVMVRGSQYIHEGGVQMLASWREGGA